MRHTYTVDGVDASSSGTSHVGFVQDHKYETGGVEAVSVVAEQTGAADADWNVELGGNDLFSSENSVDSAGTPEEFTPDQNKTAAGDTLELAVDVSGSSGTGSSTLNLSVLVDDLRDD